MNPGIAASLVALALLAGAVWGLHRLGVLGKLAWLLAGMFIGAQTTVGHAVGRAVDLSASGVVHSVQHLVQALPS